MEQKGFVENDGGSRFASDETTAHRPAQGPRRSRAGVVQKTAIGQRAC